MPIVAAAASLCTRLIAPRCAPQLRRVAQVATAERGCAGVFLVAAAAMAVPAAVPGRFGPVLAAFLVLEVCVCVCVCLCVCVWV